jgi:DNA-binding MarR family transcriptional regulator
MATKIDITQIPRAILEKAIQLDNSLKRIFLCLYCCTKPVMAIEVAQKVGLARAYVHMRLIQLERMGYVKRSREGRKVKFKVI